MDLQDQRNFNTFVAETVKSVFTTYKITQNRKNLMKNLYIKTIASFSILAAVALTPAETKADWEIVHPLPSTYAHFITSEGVHLMSNYLTTRNGGIYYSEDNGQTWTKSDVRDYWYSNFYEADGYIFALGSSCRIGRSEDGGRTWDLLNYSNAVKDYVPEKALDGTVCYGITSLDGVLYIGDFSGGGVLRSEDYGETWEMTDRNTLYINLSGVPEPQMDSFYKLEAYNGMVYAFGLYSVHAFVPEEMKWKTVPINSNCMASVTVMDNKMYGGRAIMNYDVDADYILQFDDTEIGTLPRPDTDDNNIRCLSHDGSTLYSMHHGGKMYYTSDLGQSWYSAPDFKENLYPLTLSFDDEYVYTGVYSPNPKDDGSGLWRISKAELDQSGVKSVSADKALAPVYDGKYLYCPRKADRITVTLIDGKMVMSVDNVAGADLSNLPEGVYVYKVDHGTSSYSGKLIKK